MGSDSEDTTTQVVFRRAPRETVELLLPNTELILGATAADWLRTLSRHRREYPGAMIADLRLATGMSQKQFAPKAFMLRSDLTQIEISNRRIEFSTIRKLIHALDLDEKGQIAQLLFLSLNRVASGLLSLSEADQGLFGQLFRNLRVQRGLTPATLAEPLERCAAAIENMEADKVKHLNLAVVRRFIGYVGLSEESVLAKMLLAKASQNYQSVSQEMLRSVLSEGFLFADHIVAADTPLKRGERALRDKIRESSIGPAIVALRGSLSRRELAETLQGNSGFNQGDISKFEQEKHLPSDLTILKLANARGYDFHHQGTLALLDLARKTRAQRIQRSSSNG